MPNWISRLVVAAIGLPLVLGLLWLGGWWLFGLLAVACVAGLHELYYMTRPLRPLVIAGYTGALLALLGAELGGTQWLLGGLLATIPLAFVLKGVADTRQSATVAVAATALGAVWVGAGLAHVLLIRDLPEHGREAAYAVLLAAFASDTVAYLGGRLVGRHKLAPMISPGKTWEGLLFGMAAAVFVTWVTLYKSDWIDGSRAVVLGLAIAVAAPLGDLFESALKRDMQVKDASRLLGGHGGMLDRLDSVLFSAVAAYYVIAAYGYA